MFVGVLGTVVTMGVREMVEFRGRYNQTRHCIDRIAEGRPPEIPQRNWHEMIGGARTTLANTVFSPSHVGATNHRWLNERLFEDAMDDTLSPLDRLERFYEHTRRIGPKADAYVETWKPRFHDAWLEGD